MTPTSLGLLLAEVLPLALGAAVSPVILLLQMATLTRGERRMARATLVAAGAAVALVAWATVGWFLVNHLPTPRRGPDVTSAAVDLVLALVLVALGLRSLVHRGAETAPKPPGRPRLGVAFGLGLAAMASNVTTIVLVLPAVRDVARADLDAPSSLVALALVLLITLAPALLPLLAVALGGAPGRRALDRIGAFTEVHQSTIAAVVSFGFAVFLGAKGLRSL